MTDMIFYDWIGVDQGEGVPIVKESSRAQLPSDLCVWILDAHNQFRGC